MVSLDDRFLGKALIDLPAAQRALTWYVRASNAQALPADLWAQFAGATFMIEGLVYHYDSYVRHHETLRAYRAHLRELSECVLRDDSSFFDSLRMMTQEERHSAQACAHEAIAYLNRLGQFFYFAKSTQIDRAHLFKRVAELMPIRMKFAAHRSIDFPHGESEAVRNQQGMSFAHTMFANQEIEFQFRTDEDIIRFRLQDDHPIVLSECFEILESFYRE